MLQGFFCATVSHFGVKRSETDSGHCWSASGIRKKSKKATRKGGPAVWDTVSILMSNKTSINNEVYSDMNEYTIGYIF